MNSPHPIQPPPRPGGPAKGRSPVRAFLGRLRTDPKAARTVVQVAFLVLCLWIGAEFALFMRWGASGGRAAYVPHPAGAEGFLPISALLSLKHWLLTGKIHPVHPAGLFILVAILAMGLLLKKAFCSWICPVGTLSEALWLLGRKGLGRNLALPRWADAPLRGVKYLLLGFFLWAIWSMDGPVLEAFLDSPFNAVADIRMYLFFAYLSGLALGIVLALAGALPAGAEPVVPLPLPLRRPAGAPEPGQPPAGHPQQEHLHRLPALHPGLPGADPGAPGQPGGQRRMHRLLPVRGRLPGEGHSARAGPRRQGGAGLGFRTAGGGPVHGGHRRRHALRSLADRLASRGLPAAHPHGAGGGTSLAHARPAPMGMGMPTDRLSS